MGFLAKAVPLVMTVMAATRPTTGIPWSRLPAVIALGGVCFGIFMTAVGFLLAAVYLALEPVWGAGWAAFTVGMGLLPIGGIFVFALHNLITQPIQHSPGDEVRMLMDDALRGVETAEDWVAERPLTALGGALAIGAIAALIMFRGKRR